MLFLCLLLAVAVVNGAVVPVGKKDGSQVIVVSPKKECEIKILESGSVPPKDAIFINPVKDFPFDKYPECKELLSNFTKERSGRQNYYVIPGTTRKRPSDPNYALYYAPTPIVAVQVPANAPLNIPLNVGPSR